MSIPPASLQAFWSGPIAASPAFSDLHSWAEVMGVAMPETMGPLAPASRISSAVRRILDAPKPSSSQEVDPLLSVLSVIQDRREYCGTLLRFASDSVAACLEDMGGEGKSRAERQETTRKLDEWLGDVGRVLASYRAELTELSERFARAEKLGLLPLSASSWMLEVAERLYERLARVHGELGRVSEILSDRLNAAAMAEIRRRLSWVTSLREFSRDFDWEPSSAALKIPASARSSKFEMGLVLLDQCRDPLSQKEIDLYERAASSTSVRDRKIALDWAGVVGAELDPQAARAEMEAMPEFYDVLPEDLVWQSTRFPYRGAQALLLGLWAAGNHLFFYSDAEGDGHVALFNDFPLLKVAFRLAVADDAHVPVTRSLLQASSHYMDASKRRLLGMRSFQSADGKRLLSSLSRRAGVSVDLARYGRIPFPDFAFDVFVGTESPQAPADVLERMGFGPRWIEGTGDAAGLLVGLEAYFARPLTGVSPAVSSWLDTWEMP